MKGIKRCCALEITGSAKLLALQYELCHGKSCLKIFVLHHTQRRIGENPSANSSLGMMKDKDLKT